MKRICVFCGSSTGNSDIFAETAKDLGATMARGGVEIVYGGASVGLMGLVAEACLTAGGQVIGILPAALRKVEIAKEGLSDLRIVDTMHERKAMMGQLADGFVALPGGFGTVEELFEMLTWLQLGFHQKPCAILNIMGFYDPLLDFLDRAVAAGFLKPIHRQMLIVKTKVADLLPAMQSFEPTAIDKWSRTDRQDGGVSNDWQLSAQG